MKLHKRLTLLAASFMGVIFCLPMALYFQHQGCNEEATAFAIAGLVGVVGAAIETKALIDNDYED